MTLAGTQVRADISDSGNLTIGGTAVIQGTMTVQGTAFSVGGTTFSVNGGSVTLGGILNVSAAGIKWADGTISVSSGGGGAGNVVLNATQTFSGANTFTNLMTVSSGIHVTAPALATAPANTLTSGSFIKGWAVYTSTPATPVILDSMNVAAIGDIGAGVTIVYWNTRYASEQYVTTCSSLRTDITNANVCNVYALGSTYYSPDGSSIQTTNFGGSGVDMKIFVMSIGKQ